MASPKSSAVEEDKHKSQSQPPEEVKKLPKEIDSPEGAEAELVFESVQKEFEDYKKGNAALNTAELSFEKPVPDEDDKGRGENDSAASSSHFSLGAPIHSSAPVQPESVVDRQMSMLMNNLISIVSKQKDKLKEKAEKYKKRETELMKDQVERSEELEHEKTEWEKQKKSLLQPENSDLVELNIGGTHTLTTVRSTLTKVHNSLLAAMFSPGNKLTTHKGKVFIDRDGEPFMKMVSYLRNGHVPAFGSRQHEQNFRDELEFWQIPLGSDQELENARGFAGEFDEHWCAATLRLENENRVVIKQGPSHGIVFLKTPLNALCPYISFKVIINAPSRGRSSLFAGLVDRTNYTQEHLVSTSWKDSPASYYWDVWSRRLVSIDGSGTQTGLVNNYGCACEGTETEVGILYNAATRSVNFYKNSIDQGVAFKNVRPDLYPALDLWFASGSIEVLTASKPSSKTYL